MFAANRRKKDNDTTRTISLVRVWQNGPRVTIDFAGDGLLLGIVMFTPAFLFGAAARRGPGPPAVPEGSDQVSANASSRGWLSSGQMVFVGCAILTIFGLLIAYLAWQLTRTGGY